jgi:hypothetical protein
MKLAPKTWWRPVLLLTLGLCSIGWVLWKKHIPQRVYDPTGALREYDRQQFNQFTAAMMRETGLDLRIVLDSLADNRSLERTTLEMARTLGMGRTSGKRGLLLYYDLAGGKLRFETGPHLEGTFTDAFLGYLIRGHTHTYLEHQSLAKGLYSTLMIVQHRLRESALQREFDPSIITAVLDSTGLATGAGVSVSITAPGGARLLPVRDSLLEAAFGPAPTAEAALARYHLWLRLPAYLPDAGLFTPRSRSFLRGEFRMTPAFLDFLRYLELGKTFRVETVGDRAVAFATADPLVGPHFFVRTPGGWQVDLSAELTNTHELAGGRFTWTLVETGDAYDSAFAHLRIGEWPIIRFADGDNTPLPVRGSNR